MKLTPPTAFWLRCRLPYDVGLLFYWSVCWVEQTTEQSLRRANAMFATPCLRARSFDGSCQGE